MALDPFLAYTFRHTVYVAARTGTQSDGDPTFGAAAPVAASVEYKRERTVGGNGEETFSTAEILLLSAVTATDRIWLPPDGSSDAKKAKIPLSVGVAKDEFGGIAYYVVTV